MENLNFKILFTRRELSEIKGYRNRNYIILISILFGTFLAVTIADGGLDYLRLRMRDPFVKNLDVKVPYEQSANVTTYKFFLNQDSLKQKFHYDTVMSHVEMALMFWNFNNSDWTYEKGRSIEFGNPILDQVLGKKNLVHGRGFKEKFDYGLIVTRKLLRDFGYPEHTHFIEMAVPRIDEGHFKVPIPVIAVVNEIPGLANFAYTPYFYSTRNEGYNNPFNLEKYKGIYFYLPGDNPSQDAAVKATLRDIVTSHESFKDRDPFVESYDYNYSYEEGRMFSVSFYPAPSSEEELELMYEELVTASGFEAYRSVLQRAYFYDMPSTLSMEPTYDAMSFMFSSLRQVSEFKDYLFKNYELEVEMSKVKDKENFIAISFLTITMAIILLIFSVFSVALFVYNLLRNHLSKITMNLGTFKAFGMSNMEIKEIYRQIIRKFCLASIGIALAAVFVLDVLVVGFYLRELQLWHMLNIYTLIAIVAIVVSVEWTVIRISNRILENTPGDLIYGRDKE